MYCVPTLNFHHEIWKQRPTKGLDRVHLIYLNMYQLWLNLYFAVFSSSSCRYCFPYAEWKSICENEMLFSRNFPSDNKGIIFNRRVFNNYHLIQSTFLLLIAILRRSMFSYGVSVMWLPFPTSRLGSNWQSCSFYGLRSEKNVRFYPQAIFY